MPGNLLNHRKELPLHLEDQEIVTFGKMVTMVTISDRLATRNRWSFFLERVNRRRWNGLRFSAVREATGQCVGYGA